MTMETLIKELENKGVTVKCSSRYATSYDSIVYDVNFYYKDNFLTSDVLETGYNCKRTYDCVLEKLQREKDSEKAQDIIRHQGLDKAIETFGSDLVYQYDLLGILGDFVAIEDGYKCLDTDEETVVKLSQEDIKDFEITGWRVWA